MNSSIRLQTKRRCKTNESIRCEDNETKDELEGFLQYYTNYTHFAVIGCISTAKLRRRITLCFRFPAKPL